MCEIYIREVGGLSLSSCTLVLLMTLLSVPNVAVCCRGFVLLGWDVTDEILYHNKK